MLVPAEHSSNELLIKNIYVVVGCCYKKFELLENDKLKSNRSVLMVQPCFFKKNLVSRSK